MHKKFIVLIRLGAAAVLVAGVAQILTKKLLIGALVIAAGVLVWAFAAKIVAHLGLSDD